MQTGLIRAIRFAKGSNHDYKMYKEKGFEIAENIQILADLGFKGIDKEHFNSVLPHKKSKLKPLNNLQKEENKQQASKRVLIEHINRDCKIFRICGNKYRGKHKKYEDNWTLITSIVNLKKATNHLRYATI